MNIANKLTLGRIFMIPIFIILLTVPLDWGQVTWLGAVIPIHQLIAGIIFNYVSRISNGASLGHNYHNKSRVISNRT